ncbi:MAG: sigma-54-dependent Fis family transcriptional regulator [Proteobacteria bacterium]|nr:sigma-54-dependent Fis family transcriptional regulator [Pseudomonadota bacterium]
MDKEVSRILLVEDDVPQRKTLAGFLTKRGYEVIEAGSAMQAESEAKKNDLDLLMTDLRLGGPDGIELLYTLKRRHPEIEALVLTAYGTVDDAVRAMRAGAYDFLTKPVDLNRLEALVEKALERVSLTRENRGLREVVKSSGMFSDLVGESDAMKQVKELALKVAPSRASSLVLGESGTGKEVLARAMHRASPRREKPFMTVNCAALSQTLVESELFGHEKGAFTGATGTKKGRFELAHGGTLFLDEIGDIPLATQVKLLGVIQSGCFERVGGTEKLEVDVRIISATHRDLEAQISDGSFREDLYYRLNVVTIVLPPLRNRTEDIPLLVDHFLSKHADLSNMGEVRVEAQVLDRLVTCSFPGNVRQLENWIERAIVLADEPQLTKDDFPIQLFSPQTQSSLKDRKGGLEDQVAHLEITLIKEALRNHNGNKSAAARELELTERAIRYKITKYAI